MTPGALSQLATRHEERAPGLAFVLREWSLCLRHGEVLSVATEALSALAGAERLSAVVPDDADHRATVKVLEQVFLSVARAVFRRDARRSFHG